MGEKQKKKFCLQNLYAQLYELTFTKTSFCDQLILEVLVDQKHNNKKQFL